jgi:hypothetical protein
LAEFILILSAGAASPVQVLLPFLAVCQRIGFQL